MAWHFARYTEAVAAAGKKEYPLPMFVNAALIRPGHQPGQYPSAGPLPHLFDVWRAAAPSVDFLAPDIYFQNFAEWARRYRRSGNPLFVPEAMRSPEASVNALYAFGAHDAIGFSPFGIETIGEPAATHLAASYDLVAQLEPLLVERQGKGLSAGLLSEGPEQGSRSRCASTATCSRPRSSGARRRRWPTGSSSRRAPRPGRPRPPAASSSRPGRTSSSSRERRSRSRSRRASPASGRGS